MDRPGSPARETVGAYLDRWIKLQTGLEHSTWATYEGHVRNHIKPALGRILLSKLSPLQVQEWIRAREKVGLSPRTIEQMRAVLRVALADAERWELVERNVARLVNIPSKRRREVTPLAPDEARAFIGAIRGHPFEAAFLLAVATGLRQGELLGLRWEYVDDGQAVRDIDLDTGTLTVRYALARVKGEWVYKSPKTDKSRRKLALPRMVVDSLTRHRDRQTFERAALNGQDTGLVFTSTRLPGAPVWGTTLTREFQRVLAKAGLPRQRFHDLRHGAASLWIAQGASLKEVAATLGHSQISITADLYAHLFEGQRRAMATRMDDILGG